MIGDELQEMNMSLGINGTEILANYKNIEKTLEKAFKKFRRIRNREEDMRASELSASGINNSTMGADDSFVNSSSPN